MSDDIRLCFDFAHHRKRKKLQMRLGAEGVLALIDLWLVTGRQRPSGVLNGYSTEDIAIDANWSGDPNEFVSALVDVGFLDEQNGEYSFHKWEERQGWVVATDNRSDASRFSRLKAVYPNVYNQLSEKGIKKVTKKQYAYLKKTLTEKNESLTNVEEFLTIREGSVEVSLSPTPTPTPTPNPSPSPSPFPSPSPIEITIPTNPENTSEDSSEDTTQQKFSKEIPPGINKLCIEFIDYVSDKHGKKAPKKDMALITNSERVVYQLIRLDGFDLDYIEKVLTWARDDSFWATNVLSLAGLRKKTDGTTKFQKIAAKYDDSLKPKSYVGYGRAPSSGDRKRVGSYSGDYSGKRSFG